MMMNSENVDGVESAAGHVLQHGELPTEKAKWVSLNKFQITCQGSEKVRCPVYANQRQQVPVLVIIEARDADNVVVPVDPNHLKLGLCNYHTGELFNGGLSFTFTEDARFIYHWNLEGAGQDVDDLPAESPKNGAQVFKAWITVSRVESFKVAARCTSPDGITFITNTPNPTVGKFDSWLQVDGREPVIITWDKLAISGPRNVYTHFPFDVDLYYVYFNDPLNTGLRIVDAINYRGGADTCHYAWMKGVRRFEQAAFRVLPARTLNYQSCNHSASFRLGERPGQADVGRIRNNLGGPCGNYSYQHGFVGYINQYGNETQVVLRAASDGNTISLASPRLLEEGSEAPPTDDE